MATLNPNAAEWRPLHLQTRPSRPDSEQQIRNTYIRIINSYRLRLEVEYQQTGNCPEQSIYNTDVDIDVAFDNVDKGDVELYAKDFRGYVRHGIWGDSFPSWIEEEDDLIPIVFMAINDEIHNITKRVFIVNDNYGDDNQVDEYYCLGVDGKRVELSSDLLDLAEQVTGRIANDEGNDDISEYCMSAWSITADEGWGSYTVTDTKYWKPEHCPNTLQKSKAGNGWWTFYEVHKSNGGAWRYICHPDITKLHLKLSLSSSLIGLHHAFPNLTALVIDYTEHSDGAGQYGDHFCLFRGEPVLNYCCSVEPCGIPEHNKYHALLDKLYNHQRSLAIVDEGTPYWAADSSVWLRGHGNY